MTTIDSPDCPQYALFVTVANTLKCAFSHMRLNRRRAMAGMLSLSHHGMVLFLQCGMRSHKCQFVPVVFVCPYRVACLQLPVKQQFAYAVLDVSLDGAFERTRAELHVVAFGCDKYLGLVGYLEFIAKFIDALLKAAKLNVYDFLYRVKVELVEGYYFVQAVQEFRAELLAQAFFV